MKRRNFLGAFGALFAVPLLSIKSKAYGNSPKAKTDNFLETITTMSDNWTTIFWCKPSKNSATIFTALICGKRIGEFGVGSFKLEGTFSKDGTKRNFSTTYHNTGYQVKTNLKNGLFSIEVQGAKDHIVDWVCEYHGTTVY